MSELTWKRLKTAADLDKAVALSHHEHVIIFKHSSRCGVSSMALSGLESKWEDNGTIQIKPFFLDLIAHRDLSSRIAEQFKITHQSPQVLLIKDGKCYYSASHLSISYANIAAAVRGYTGTAL